MLMGTIKTQSKLFFFFSAKFSKPTQDIQLSSFKSISLHSLINKTQSSELFFSWRFPVFQPNTINNPKTTSLLLY